MREIKLGDKLKDKVSGIEGICTARIEYLNGCVQWAIHPKMSKDGKNESYWIDEQQIERLGSGLNVQPKRTGGAMPRPAGGLNT